MSDNQQPTYRWYILALATLTSAFVASLPFSCMPVLFKEISDDLGLSLVQIGTIWGLASLAGLFISLIAGILGDRFGVKHVLAVSCLLTGVTGALRGLSNSFLTLAVTVFINGAVRLIVPVNLTKTIDLWFKGHNLGMAMGISAMGMGLGLMLGPMISASVLSPLLGGWRNVMYLYGAVSLAVGILWLIFGREPGRADLTAEKSTAVPIRQAFSKLIYVKDLWLIAGVLLLRVGCIMGMTGYLPLYLREQGWAGAGADGALSSYYAASTLCVVPLSSLSDRIGSRKVILIPGLIVTVICFGLIPIVEGGTIWLLMILSGIFMDGFMAVSVVMMLETKGIGPAYSGTAVGILFTIANIGNVFSPPLGNSLASIDQGLPFVFWASLSLAALIILFFIHDTGWRTQKAVEI